MRLGALQPGYLPWLGFFDQIERCDVFILYDELPYTSDSWRNRNRIRMPQGWRWLTVPVVNRGSRQKTIRDIEISDQGNWRRSHWLTIRNHYARAPFFAAHEAFFAHVYERQWRYLIDLDVEVIVYLLQALRIETTILLASEKGFEAGFVQMHAADRDPTDRVAFLCRQMGADRFLEGALGRDFMEPTRLDRHGVTLDFHAYQHPYYHQVFGGFVPYLSVIDLLFNHGPDSLDILTGRQVLSPQ